MNFTLADVTVPTILIEGSNGKAQEYVEQHLQEYFCKQENRIPGQCYCIECRRISQRQHPFLVWITPEKDYTVDEVDTIFDRTHFMLDPEQRFFFVLDKAQTLNQATANRLLKVLEEPPTGYQFILITNNQNALLPTIRSRSYFIQLQTPASDEAAHPLAAFFYAAEKLNDPFSFEQELAKHDLSEGETVELCFTMLHCFAKKLAPTTTNDSSNDQHYIQNVIDVLQDHLHKPPCPGSANFFWKRLFLNFPRHRS